MTESKWKSNLLSSSKPLEFEAAKVLARRRFAVSYEYKYSRYDGSTLKDFSVDLHARSHLPLGEESLLEGELSLLIECKYRKPSTEWLFWRDPNDADLSPITLGRTLRIVDEFARFAVPRNATITLDEMLLHGFAGVEIDSSGGVYDKEIRHGISQLQYALPSIVVDHINWCAWRPFEDRLPLYLCPVLLTTAPLFLANEDVSVADVEATTSLRGIAEQVPFLMLYSGYGPDFQNHCVLASRDLRVEPHRTEQHDYRTTRHSLIDGLREGRSWDLQALFTQYIVCSFDAFGELLGRIEDVAHAANASKGDRPQT